MADTTTIGKVLFNKALPEKYRDESRTLDKKSLTDLLSDIAKEDQDGYIDTLQRVSDVSRMVVSDYGRTASFSLKDFQLPPALKTLRTKYKDDVAAIANDARLTSEQKSAAIVKKLSPEIQRVQDLLLKAEDGKNSFVDQVKIGARGNTAQLMQLLFGDMLVLDHKNRPIPIPGLHSYGEGVTPIEYWAASYGSRKGYCLSENTFVRMADFSIKKIKDVQIGEFVLGADIKGKTFPVEVLEVLDNGVKELYRYIFRIGRMKNTIVSLDATEEHQVLSVIKNGTKTPHLRTPSKLPLSRAWRCFGMIPAGAYKDDREAEQPYARLLGLLLGDGHLSEPNSVTLTSEDTGLIEKLNEELEDISLEYIPRDRTSGMPSYEYAILGAETRDKEKYRNPIKRYLDKFNLLGKKSYEKSIPEEIYSWSNKDITNLIHGLYESDGWCKKSSKVSMLPCIGWDITSKKMLLQIKELLQTRFGIYSTNIEINPLEKKKTSVSYGYTVTPRRDSYTIRISNRDSVNKFIKLLGYGIKSDKARVMLKACPDAVRDDSLVFSYMGKEYLGEKHTYDLNINHSDHLFVLANGMIVSNSDVQFATADSGYFGKQLTQAAHRVVVTEDDCGAENVGIEVDGDDADNIGSILVSKDVPGIKAGTELDKKYLPLLEGRTINVRSATTCQAKEGICSKCAGRREDGEFPSLGDAIGVTAARAIAEPTTQAGLCLHKDTLVRMADWSVKKIKDIKKGDKVLGADTQGRTFSAPVCNIYNNGVKDIYKTIFRKGSSSKVTIELESTLDHKVLQITSKSNCKGEQYKDIPRILPAGEPCSKISAVLQESFIDDKDMKEEPFALLIGLLLGDGCYTDSVNGAYFSCADDSLIEDIQPYLNTLNLKAVRLKYHDGIYYRISSIEDISERDELGHFIKGSRNPARKWLEENNMWGKYAHEKIIPECANTWNNESIAELIGGLIVTDGSIYYSGDNHKNRPYFAFGSTSEKLTSQIKDFLQWRFGIHTSNIYKNYNPAHRKRPMYTFTVSNEDSIIKFIDNIPLYGIKQHKKANVELDKGVEGLKYYRCRKISSEHIGQFETYDIGVDHPDHLFVLANGLIVSNSSKHSGGVVGEDDKKVTGFKEINQFVQVPKNFIGSATLSKVDGSIGKISKAPQGGNYVYINDEEHYVPEERKLEAKIGQRVEAGDALSSGVPNPGEVVKYKGIGEGRRYFVERYNKILKENGAGNHRRNIEAIARGFINRVRVTDPNGFDGHLVNDVLSYDDVVRDYEPRFGSKLINPKQAVGAYLEKPILHYSIGTIVTPNIAKRLAAAKAGNILIHKDQPPFEPFVSRIMDVTSTDKDWMTRLSGFNLKKSFLDAAQRGSTSEIGGTSFVPSVASGQEIYENIKKK